MLTSDLIAAIAELDAEQLPAVSAAVTARLVALASGFRPETQDALLTVPQAAAQLGLQPPTVYELVKRGAIVAVRDKKFIRIKQSALNAYIAAHEQRGPVPNRHSNLLSCCRHDRGGLQETARMSGTHASRTRQKNWRASGDNSQMGNRRGEGS